MKSNFASPWKICLWLAASALSIFPAAAQQNHALVAHYSFDNGDGGDSSGHGNDEFGQSFWLPPYNGYLPSTNAVAGGALFFDGGESISSTPVEHTFANWLAMYYGSFSISLWINTTNVVGHDGDQPDGNNGATVIWAYNDHNGGNDGTIPIAITGSKVAFFTGDVSTGNFDTLHSTNNVTTGQYVHVVVTRGQTTGQKKIYINGVLDSTDMAGTDHLDGNSYFYSIGGVNGSSYTGLLDDVQFYSGVLSASDVAFLHSNPGSTVPDALVTSSGLVAHYDFDEGFALAPDLSGHGNNLLYGGNFGGPIISTNAAAGSGAVYFNGAGYLTPSSNLLAAIVGNFTLSLWVKTTQNGGSDGDPAFYGRGIVSADLGGLTDDLIPMALTGGTIGFNTGGENDDTLNGATDINDGNYHHVVVTRDQASGAKQIFIDGSFSSSETATTDLLNAPQLITIGALADGGQSDPSSPGFTGYNGFVGWLDDIQFYSRVLSPSEISALYSAPGSNATNGLVAHYDFDESTILAPDVSGNGNDIVYASYFDVGPTISGTAKSGSGAASFNGSAFMEPEGNLLTNLSGNFSLSLWLSTAQILGATSSSATNGAGIITADVPGSANDLVPLSSTGGELAFGTGGGGYNVLRSTSTLSDGNYHHVVITRNQGTGQKQMYIDGALNNSSTATTAILNSPQILVFGAQADAGQTDPFSVTSDGFNGYLGLMDEVQIYSRVISPTEVAYLYNNPGQTLAPTPLPSFGLALGATNLSWNTSGSATWLVESKITYSTNIAAARSGSLYDNQSSLLQTTVNGPGVITFYWQTIAASDNFTLEFDIDGAAQNQISSNTTWQAQSYLVDSGTHTLTWNANTLQNSGSSTNDAGFLDQVVYTLDSAPQITVQPFSQTNYPGYSVALYAAASGIPAPTWQWFKAGNPNPINGATGTLFVPADSGSNSVAGSYYAIASNPAGSQQTASATITFVSAPLPPDWSEAIRSPFVNNDNNGTYKADDNYYSCLVDATGTNIISAGYSDGTNYFNGLRLANAPDQSAAVIVKETTGKTALWLATVTNNGHGSAYAEGLAPAPLNGVYVCGGFFGTNWMGTNLLQDSGVGGVFLARLDANGSPIWIRTLTNASGAIPILNGLVADASGNVTLSGFINSSTKVGASNLTVSGQTGFLAQYNSAGAVNWAETLASAALSLQASNGRIYASLLNYFDSYTNLTIGGLANNPTRNWSLAALNGANGQGIWVRDLGEASGSQIPNHVIDDAPLVTASGSSVFVVGTAYGSSAVFGSFTVALTGGRGQYFARYDTNGNAQLATGFGSTTTQPQAAVADAFGDVYVAGDFDTYSFFGNDIIAAPRLATTSPDGFSQGFVAKFDRNGSAQWARFAQSSSGFDAADDEVNFSDIALAPNGVWVSGFGDGPVSFGTNTLSSDALFTVAGSSIVVTDFRSGMLGLVIDPALIPPITLFNATQAGVNFQFSFVSTASHTNFVQYSTNLAATNWLSYTNIAGDGSVKTIVAPVTRPTPQFFRVVTQ